MPWRSYLQPRNSSGRAKSATMHLSLTVLRVSGDLNQNNPCPSQYLKTIKSSSFLSMPTIAECNDACARMYGLTNAEELIGKRMIRYLAQLRSTKY